MRDLKKLLSDERWVRPRSPSGSVCVAYPGSYAEASASLGFHFTVGLGGAGGADAGQRAFAPSSEPLMRRSALADPLRVVETARSVAGMRALLLSVAFELQIRPVIEILAGAGLEPLRQQRSRRDPLVVAGGACTLSNPDLLVPFADAVVVGDGEEAMDVLGRAVAAGADREDALEALRAVPSVIAGEEGLEGFEAGRAPDARLPVRSVYVAPGSAFRAMFLVEVMRGCPHGCAFCLFGSKRPGGGARFVPAADVLRAVPAWAKRVGLVGASVLDHPEIDAILEELAGRSVEIGLSSLRAGRLTEDRARLLTAGKVATATVALDSPSERIRRRVRKPSTGTDLVRAAGALKRGGIGRMKLYALVGFEGEDGADHEELAELCRELASMIALTVAVGPVVPKRFTALDGAELMPRRAYDAAVALLRRRLAGRARIKAASYRAAKQEFELNHMGAGEARELAAGCGIAAGRHP
jgi:hypothetical protein